MKLVPHIKTTVRTFISIIALIIIFIIVTISNSALFSSNTKMSNVVWQGFGSKEDPFIINSLSDLISLRDFVNNGTSIEECYFQQICSIDLGAKSVWIPIGEFGSNRYFYSPRTLYESLKVSSPADAFENYWLNYRLWHSRYSELNESDFSSYYHTPLYQYYMGFGINFATTKL